MEYHVAGQLVKVKPPKGEYEYRYDGQGTLLVWSKSNGEVTSYLPHPFASSGFTLAEYTDDTERYYTYGESLRPAGIRKLVPVISLRMVSIPSGSVADEVGEIVARRDYSPFGEMILTRGRCQVTFVPPGEKVSN